MELSVDVSSALAMHSICGGDDTDSTLLKYKMDHT